MSTRSLQFTEYFLKQDTSNNERIITRDGMGTMNARQEVQEMRTTFDKPVPERFP
jgi:hypothetical protein